MIQLMIGPVLHECGVMELMSWQVLWSGLPVKASISAISAPRASPVAIMVFMSSLPSVGLTVSVSSVNVQ